MILYYQENVARDADARLLVRLTREVTRETAGETDTADAAPEDFEAAVEAAGKDAEENRKYSLLSKLRAFCRKTCYRCSETHCSRSGCHVQCMDIFQENLPSIWIIPVRMVISVLLLYCPVFAVRKLHDCQQRCRHVFCHFNCQRLSIYSPQSNTISLLRPDNSICMPPPNPHLF